MKKPTWIAGSPSFIRWERWRPRLVLPRRHEREVRWGSRAFAVVGVAASFIAMPPHIAAGFSIALLVVEQFLERTVFLFSSMHITPLPDFEYDPEKWTGMAFFESHPPMPFGIGLVFSDADYARHVFGLLFSWNLEEAEDLRNNVCLSIVTDESEYWVWIYPNHDREPVRRSMRNLGRRARRRGRENEPFLLTVSFTFCHRFIDKGGLAGFLDSYETGSPFLLIPVLQQPSGQAEPIVDIRPLSKTHLKVKERDQLTEEDYEFAVWRARSADRAE